MGILGVLKYIFKGRSSHGIQILEVDGGKDELLVCARHNRRYREAVTELIMEIAALNLESVNDLLKKYSIALEENADGSKHIVIEFPNKRWH